VTALTNDLNARKVPAPRGGLWHQSVVRSILKCPHYVGDLVWNRLHQGKYFGVEAGAIAQKRRRVMFENNPKEHWITVTDTHEALVTRAMWEAAQRKLLENRQPATPHRGGGDFALSGLVFCGHCNSRMVGFTVRTRSTQPYARMVCGRYLSCGRS